MNFTEEQLRELTANNTSFSKEVPGLQIAWDSSSLGLLKECPRKYAYVQLMGYGDESDHLTFGTLYHECQEIYKLAIHGDKGYDEALHSAVKHALTASGHHEEIAVCMECGSAKAGSDRDLDNCPDCGAAAPWSKEEMVWVPWESDIPEKNRFTLVRSIVWWAETFRHEDETEAFKTKVLKDGTPAVEIAFRFDSGVSNQLSSEGNYIFCGRLDEAVEHMNLTFIKDTKTSKYSITPDYFDKYSPDNQMSMYSAAGRVCLGEPVAGIMIDATQVLVNISRFSRGFAERTPNQLEEWMHDQEYWLRMNEQFVRNRYWPMNDTSCSKYGGCPFQKRRLGAVCSKDPSVRTAFLDSNFKRRVWDPLKRGESNPTIKGDLNAKSDS